MTNQELFEKIQSGHDEKKILSLCKKLVKKCSFHCGADAQNLCKLAYLLFVYGCEEEALSLCGITHDAAFPGRGGYNVWDYIMFMWGLEAHILQKRKDMAAADERIRKMDALWMLPPAVPEQEMARRSRFTLAFCSREDEIRDSTSSSMKNDWRLTALYHLIGYGATGLFPNLDREKEAVGQLAQAYIHILKGSK